ncbi:MAG: hypothetical protein VW239_02485, partial [Candidatus Nanopelagicales bacterium]
VAGAQSQGPRGDAQTWGAAVADRVAVGDDTKLAIAAVARQYDAPRRDVYDAYVAVKAAGPRK